MMLAAVTAGVAVASAVVTVAEALCAGEVSGRVTTTEMIVRTGFLFHGTSKIFLFEIAT